MNKNYDPYVASLVQQKLDEQRYRMYWNFGMILAGYGANQTTVEAHSCMIMAIQEQITVDWGEWRCYPSGHVQGNKVIVV